MKLRLLLPLLGLVMFASSCRTVLPIDPMTSQPSARCLPPIPCPEHYESEICATK